MVYGGRQFGNDMIAVAIMTHGMVNKNRYRGLELLCSNGLSVPLFELISPILKCRQLVHRPKIFFIQACQGRHEISQGICRKLGKP